ncbi:MAG: hydrogenase nickel incorporation protein HypB [Candidatus Zixiibacteriota bacterium]
MTTRIDLNEKVLKENDRIAAEIRQLLAEKRILALNLVSSPGSGKTSLLERTFRELSGRLKMVGIAGDVQTENDARRLEAAGARLVRPIVTGGACHLDARMIQQAMAGMDLSACDVLFVENVGNLVCPSSYDLGEDMKVVLISTTEGDDKPLKYPAMFRRASVMIINKTDLLGQSDFDLDRVKKNAWQINGGLEILELSCRTGEGLPVWYEWLVRASGEKKKR